MTVRRSSCTEVWLVSVWALAFLVGPVVAQCPRYQVETIPGPPCQFVFSQSTATGISETGEICGGYSTCNGSGFGGIWLGQGQWVPLLPQPGVPWIAPVDINTSRQMAAFIPDPSNPEVLRRAAFYDFASSTLVDIGHLPGDNQSESYAINDHGAVCGYSASNIGRAFVWKDEMMTALNLPLGPNSVAYDMAENGAACGWMGLEPHTSAHAFIWRDGKTIDLGVVEGSLGAEARGISSNGRIVTGRVIFPDSNPQVVYQKRAFIWHDGRAENLGVLSAGHTESIAYAVNDEKVVIGISTNHNGVGPAFVWRNGVMKALNDLIPPGHQLNIDLVKSINNAGQVAGSARLTDGSNDQVAVRLTPIAPPPGDCDCNGVVNIDDLLRTINQWGPAIPTTTADFNNDGLVNVADILTVIEEWD
jgi:probable HAF family extracellular repeat protein